MNPTAKSRTSTLLKFLVPKKMYERVKAIENAKDDFFACSTIHGLSYIHNSKSKFRRIFWLLLFLASLGGLTQLVSDNYRKLQTGRNTVSVELFETDKLDFPAVTICSLNYFRKSRIQNNTVLTDYLKILFADPDEVRWNICTKIYFIFLSLHCIRKITIIRRKTYKIIKLLLFLIKAICTETTSKIERVAILLNY